MMPQLIQQIAAGRAQLPDLRQGMSAASAENLAGEMIPPWSPLQKMAHFGYSTGNFAWELMGGRGAPPWSGRHRDNIRRAQGLSDLGSALELNAGMDKGGRQKLVGFIDRVSKGKFGGAESTIYHIREAGLSLANSLSTGGEHELLDAPRLNAVLNPIANRLNLSGRDREAFLDAARVLALEAISQHPKHKHSVLRAEELLGEARARMGETSTASLDQMVDNLNNKLLRAGLTPGKEAADFVMGMSDMGEAALYAAAALEGTERGTLNARAASNTLERAAERGVDVGKIRNAIKDMDPTLLSELASMGGKFVKGGSNITDLLKDAQKLPGLTKVRASINAFETALNKGSKGKVRFDSDPNLLAHALEQASKTNSAFRPLADIARTGNKAGLLEAIVGMGESGFNMGMALTGDEKAVDSQISTLRDLAVKFNSFETASNTMNRAGQKLEQVATGLGHIYNIQVGGPGSVRDGMSTPGTTQ